MPAMSERLEKARVYKPRPRLIAARLKKYPSPEEAALALGVPAPTYRAHENGSRGLSRNAERYARFFGVPLDWLLTGRGSMTGALTVEVHGRIGAGAVVTMDSDSRELANEAGVELPNAKDCWAFVVEGDSMRPRFYAGEVVVFDRERAKDEAELLGQYCLAELFETGDRMVKILREGRALGRWWLESHYADPIKEVELKAVYRWRATLPARDGSATLADDFRPRRRPAR